jgi:Protein of unknown function (DUF1761)
MGDVNWIAVVVAAFSALALGALWYSPIAFGKRWTALTGITPEKQAAANPAITYGGSLALAFVAALIFSMFLGPNPSLGFSLGAGLSAGLCWVAASFGINYLFEQKPMSLFLINGGYHSLQFTIYGLIFGLL